MRLRIALLLALAALLLAACGDDTVEVEVRDTPVTGPTVAALGETVIAPVEEAVEELSEMVQTAPPVQTVVSEAATVVGLPDDTPDTPDTFMLTDQLQQFQYSCPNGQIVIYSLSLNPLGDGTYALTRAAGDWISVQIVGPDAPVVMERGCDGQHTQVGNLVNATYVAYNTP